MRVTERFRCGGVWVCRALCTAIMALAAGRPSPVSAQHADMATMPASFEEPMPLFEKGLGPFSRKVTTSSAEAQAYFDQGFQLLYAFTPVDAARSFREAQERDPECAMCYWGEAWAWGPYLNGGMSAEDAPRAHTAITAAVRLSKKHASPVERALIDAMARRYEAKHDPGKRARLDTAYAKAMARVHMAYPADLEVATLYAESLMLLEPRRGSWNLERPEIGRIHDVLEGILVRDVHHPGACHLYIHATESTSRPGNAEACAEFLGDAIPGASHINHMPSHTWNRIGRWGDAVRANVKAWHSDQRAEYGEGFAIYPSHNLHMLLFAASMDGQGAIAIQAGRDYGRMVEGGEFYQALAQVRFGRFEDVLELHDPPENAIVRGLWDFGRGYAHLRLEHPDSARFYLGRVRAAAENTPESVSFRGHTAAQLLGVVGGILDGEVLRAEGLLADAIARFERAVEVEDGLTYDEPEPLNFSARDWLGAALLEVGRATEAERTYRAALEDHPWNGWALFGLEAALRAQGRTGEADAAKADFERAWRRSDVWLRASRF